MSKGREKCIFGEGSREFGQRLTNAKPVYDKSDPRTAVKRFLLRKTVKIGEVPIANLYFTQILTCSNSDKRSKSDRRSELSIELTFAANMISLSFLGMRFG